VLLVPNKSLETPHYKLERLKHDDPRLDRIEASYKMAEDMEDLTPVTRRSQEPTNKQTPIIKGVLPDAPAPQTPVKPATTGTTAKAAAAAKPARKAAAVPGAPAAATAAASGGFFGWLKNLLGGSAPAAPTSTVGKKDDKTRETRGGERRTEPREGGRDAGRESGRDGRRGGRRGERSEVANGDSRVPREGGRRGEGRSEGRADGRGEGRGEGRTELRDGEVRPARSERNERSPRDGRREGRDDSKTEGRGDAMPELTAEGTEVRAERTPRGEGRRERGERSGEGRRERGARGGERRQNDTGVDGTAPELDATGAQALSGQDKSDDAGAPESPADNTGERRERRSRDRYGRDRRERAGDTRQDAASEVPAGDTHAADAPANDPVGDDRPAPRSYFERAQPPATVAFDDTGAARATESPAPEVAAPQVQTAVLPAPAPEAAQAPAADTPARASLPPVASYNLPVEGLQAVAQSTGLVWVNSDADKVAAVQAAIAAEPVAARVPRERPPAVVLNEGPLVLVETRKDLKNMNLPF